LIIQAQIWHILDHSSSSSSRSSAITMAAQAPHFALAPAFVDQSAAMLFKVGTEALSN
jgi:hypothetical protein